ncbi:hypothetical protein QQS21_005730 [Conoideocrella luteorostrata]|uniref:Aminoglycoside phosphotransferase domain-containing protein n=1 Tax=Conoideocrella luteorostrata TaxID=1105319 RepID=A0AAJ0FYR8_9HYPO|nr:hypothetical protein QQS21_005730 [Conoideocrella luteorostrata]
MDYIHGSVASELRVQHCSAGGLFGTPEQDRKFREQMAHFQAIIASFRFSKIGGIFYNEDTDEFFVGPTSSAEYYDDLTCHLLEVVSKDHLLESQPCMLPSIRNFLLRIYGEENNGPFRLASRDFRAHNVLVNKDFDIAGVIDFDGDMAAPLEVVAQYPLHCFLQVEPPGIVDTRPVVVERVAHTLPKLQRYKMMLVKYDEGDKSGNINVADRLAVTPASAYQGLAAYQQHQELRQSTDNEIICMIFVGDLIGEL